MIEVPELAGQTLDAVLRWFEAKARDQLVRRCSIELGCVELNERLDALVTKVMIEPDHGAIRQTVVLDQFRL